MNKRRKILVSYFKISSLILLALLAKSLYFKFSPERIFTAYYPKIEYQKEILSKSNQDFQTLILGDSLATFNVKSPLISSSTLNLGLFGATFVEVFWSLQKYLEHNQTPQTIILLNGQNWEHKKEREFWPYYVGFGFFSLEELLAIYKQEGASSLLTVMKWLYYSSGIPNYNFAQLQTSLLKGSEIQRNNQFIEQLLKRDNGSMVLKERYPLDRPVFQPYHQQYLEAFKVHPSNDFYFKKLLKLASDNNIQVIMIESPLMPLVQNETAYSSFQEQVRNYYQKRLAPFHFKYCQDTVTTYQDKDFFDLDHLLESGSEKFSQFIKSCL